MEEILKYDRTNRKSVLEFAQKLKGRTLKEACIGKLEKYGIDNKGGFGQILEKYYFEYQPNSESRADFEEAGLELKSSPLKLITNGDYRSKERLVLNIINYNDVVNQRFEDSSFWKKNSSILLVFYLCEPEKDLLDFLIKLVDVWDFPKSDIEIIKKDWEFIKLKIAEGRAHELSESDTFYLGACTKGSKGGNPRSQPYSTELAKQRAFSLKQGYVNHIIASIANEPTGQFGKLITSVAEVKERSIEDIVISKFAKFYEKSVEQIIQTFGFNLNSKAKSFYADLTKAILGIGPDMEIEEFSKAEIIIKTVRLKENGMPKEDISFPSFKYETLVNEDWDESELKEIFDHKFFFVFFQFRDDVLILKKVKFWNMPFKDLEEVRNVWYKTKILVGEGRIVRDISNGVRSTYFPAKSESRVSHVRPHAKNTTDVYPLPKPDIFTKNTEYTKHCFWLNNRYIREEIFLK